MFFPPTQATCWAPSLPQPTSWASACMLPAAAWISASKTAAFRPTALSRPLMKSCRTLPASSSATTTPPMAPCTGWRWLPALPSPSRRSFCGKVLCWPGSMASACTRTCVKRRTRRISCSSARASARWSIWSVWAGRAAMSGLPTASTSMMRNCVFWPKPVQAWPTVPSAI